jgi:hypothetical protein
MRKIQDYRHSRNGTMLLPLLVLWASAGVAGQADPVVPSLLPLEAGAVAIGPNGASVHRSFGSDSWLVLPAGDARAAELGALRDAAAAHLRIAPERLLLADANGQELTSLEQATISGVIYGRQACEHEGGAAGCEQWMWPAHRPGQTAAIALENDATTASSCDPAEEGEMCPAAGPRSVVLETLSTSPRVFRVPSFLSQSELEEFNGMVRTAWGNRLFVQPFFMFVLRLSWQIERFCIGNGAKRPHTQTSNRTPTPEC